MPINLSPAELFGIAAIVIGGFWTMLKLFFSAQRKLMDERHESVRAMIISAESKFETAVQRLENTRQGFENNLHNLETDFLKYKAEAADKFSLKSEIVSLWDMFDKRFSELLDMLRHVDVKLDRKADK